VPQTRLTGFLTLGHSSGFGPVNQGQWEVKDNVSWTRGSHFFKAGYHYRYHYVFFGLQSRSRFDFSNDRFTGHSFANFLQGYLTRSVEGNKFRINLHFPSHHFYFQDNWRVSPRLTLNLGLRYELRIGWQDKRGFSSSLGVECAYQTESPIPSCFDPPVVVAEPEFPATGRFQEERDIFTFSKNGWQPRLGLSYRLFERTVLRAGGGIYGNEPPGGILYSTVLRNPRANAERREFLAGTDQPSLVLSNPFDLTAKVPGSGLFNAGGCQSPMPLWYVPSWGLSIQQQVADNTVVEFGYDGTRSVHEMQIFEFNDAVPGPGERQSRRPWPTMQSYHGFHFKLEKRPGPEGITALLTYTWAKSLDTMGAACLPLEIPPPCRVTST